MAICTRILLVSVIFFKKTIAFRQLGGDIFIVLFKLLGVYLVKHAFRINELIYSRHTLCFMDFFS